MTAPASAPRGGRTFAYFFFFSRASDSLSSKSAQNISQFAICPSSAVVPSERPKRQAARHRTRSSRLCFPRGERIAPCLRKRLGIAELYALRDKHEFFQIRGRTEYPEHIADRTAAAFKLGPHNAQHNAYLFKQAHAQAQHTRRISAREQQRRRRQDGSDHSHKNAPSDHIFQPSHPGVRRA